MSVLLSGNLDMYEVAIYIIWWLVSDQMPRSLNINTYCNTELYTVLWLRFFLTWLRFFLPWQVFLTVTEVFLFFFLSCKANARVKLAKTRHGPHSSTLVVIVLFGCYLCCSVYCLCVNVYCHQVTTQLQLINISFQLYISTGNTDLFTHERDYWYHTFVNYSITCVTEPLSQLCCICTTMWSSSSSYL
jgi:hypothetical protein